jgi:serine/threonine protein kinase/WD40 repeat protein
MLDAPWSAISRYSHRYAFMPGQDWEKLKELFERALACASPEEQRKFLDANCSSDAALRSELESLLAEYSSMSPTFLETAPVAESEAEASFALEGTLLGAYRLERQLGQGGMGTVFLASRADGAYEKQVAIKLLSGVGAGKELMRRFLAERQILARLDHPNIARLLDGGTTERGEPYLVMDYVDGIPIDRYCRERALPLEQRLQLFADVCAAVAYAHENLVVHRDIKPANILVTAGGIPKLLDFGIAKLLHPHPEDSETRTLLVLGTPEYCSPEQVRGQTITKATDVYSLGVLLYELLTGRRPYHLSSCAAHEMARVICEEDPEPPSSAISHGLARPETGAEGTLTWEADPRLRKRLSGDLDKIVMMALRKQPEQRYRTVAEFTEDIRRHAQALPVRARGRTWRYRALKFARRRKAAIGFALFTAVAVIATVQTMRQAPNARSSDTANRRVWAGVADSILPDGRLLSMTNFGDVKLHDLQTGEDRRLTRSTDGASNTSSVFSRDGRCLAYTVQFSRENPAPMELRIIGRDGTGERTVLRGAGQSWLVAHDWTDSQHVLVSSETTLLLVSIADGSLRTIPVSSGWEGRVMASPDGQYAAYTAGLEASGTHEVRIISLATGVDAALLEQPADDSLLGWSPDGARLVFRSNRAGLGSYDIWWVPVENGRGVGIPERFGPSPDVAGPLGITRQGDLFYVASNNSDEVFLSDLDPASGRVSRPRVLSGRYAGTKIAPLWTPNGRAVLFVAGDMLHFQNLSNGAERDLKPKVANLRRLVGWRPDGRSLLESAAGPDRGRGLFLIDTENGAVRKILGGLMENVGVSLDGNTLYMQGGPQSRSIVSRNLSTGVERVLCTRSHRSDLQDLRLRLSPDGQMLAMQLWDVPPGFNSLAVMPVSGGEPRVLLQIRRPDMFGAGAIAWSPDARYVYAARQSGLMNFGLGFNDHSEILRLPVAGGPAISVGRPVQGIIRHLGVSPDGRQILYQTHRTTGEIWALENFLPPAPPASLARR